MTVQAPASGAAPVAPTDPSATAQAPVTPPAAEPAKEKDQFADRLEMLSKRERSIFRQRQAIEEQSKQLQAERAEYEKWKASKEKAKQNPLDYLSQAGLSYDELTQFMLNGGKPTETSELESLRSEFKKLREDQEAKEKANQEHITKAQAAAEAQVIDGFKEEITEFLTTNKATYELSATREATEDVFTTISDAYQISLEAWRENGKQGPAPKPMAIKDAADIVEEFYEKEVLRLTETQKLKAKLGLNREEPATKGKEPSKTLTNNMASTAASVVPAKNDNDRMQRALAKLG